MLDAVEINIAGGLSFPLPRMARVRQLFDEHRIDDVGAAVAAQLALPEIAGKIKPGARIAVGVGSRGVANIGTAAQAVVGALKSCGAEPFVFPAMGSHGGGTNEGQQAVLTGFGITEEAIGAPIKVSMDTVVVAETAEGVPLHMDRHAHAADGVVLVNRIKPHTTFRGSVESGLIKMMTIGMGKINGATAIHGGYDMSEFPRVLPPAADILMARIPFLFGVGLVEDAYDNTAIVEAVPAERLLAREPELLVRAKDMMARLYFDDIDVLIIDEIGKEISGAGFDPNITGRNNRGVTGFDKPRVKKIVLLDLTDATKGNATGIGVADVITQRMLRRIDFPVTYANIVTSTYNSTGAENGG